MTTFTHTIADEHGIHARPAGELVRIAQGFTCNINIEKDPKKADGKRLFNVMGLGAKMGDVLTVTCEGEDEATAAATIEDFLKANL